MCLGQKRIQQIPSREQPHFYFQMVFVKRSKCATCKLFPCNKTICPKPLHLKLIWTYLVMYLSNAEITGRVFNYYNTRPCMCSVTAPKLNEEGKKNMLSHFCHYCFHPLSSSPFRRCSRVEIKELLHTHTTSATQRKRSLKVHLNRVFFLYGPISVV